MSSSKITVQELLKLQQKCLENIKADELYEIRNNAKLRAVYSSQSYDEFKDIVDAAHLRSLSKCDKGNAKTKTRLWNSSVKADDF